MKKFIFNATPLATLAGICCAGLWSANAADTNETRFTPAPVTDNSGKTGIRFDEIMPAPRSITAANASMTPAFDGQQVAKAFADTFPGEEWAIKEALTELGYLAAKPSAKTTRLEVTKGQIPGAPENLQAQAYKLDIQPEKITITANSPAGAFYAIQTLRQLLPKAGGQMNCGSISDWPELQLRGHMHDTGRNFQEVDLLKKQIDIWSRYKINAFHFHFTDNPGWRIESKKHPELQSPESFTRHPGKFYSQKDFQDLIAYAKKRHVTIIPELDVPGHSAAFRRAYKIDKMDSPGVRERLVELVEELCGLASVEDMPYVHLGTDEVKANERVPKEWLEDCANAVAKSGRKVIGWNQGIKVGPDEKGVQQLWANHRNLWANRQYIDSQNNLYLNHIDPFELLSAYSYQKLCPHGKPEDKLGAIVCTWHDDHARNGDDVVLMNSVIPGSLLFADSAWSGRETDERSQWARLPERTNPLFKRAENLENRLIAQRDRYFANEPFPYIRQTGMEWRIIGPFDNKGDLSAKFGPETDGIKPSYTLPDGDNVSWWTHAVPGATVYPKHFWYPSHLNQNKGTVYAFTRVFSPSDQKVDAWIGFTAFSRSSGRKRGGPTPQNGQWSNLQSKIWVNGTEIPGPKWNNAGLGGGESEETPLTDEDYFYRQPTSINLKKGWNTVLVKAPQSNAWKWVFTFTPVKPTGKGFNVVEVPGLKFSADFEKPADQAAFLELAKQGKTGIYKPSPGKAPSTPADSGPVVDFESAKPGEITELATPSGVIALAKGNANVIARGNSKLLHLAAGKDRQMTLRLHDATPVSTISFDLGRWTSVGVFELVVDVESDGQWIKVGEFKNYPTRKDLTNETVKVGGKSVTAIRFTLTTPEKAGKVTEAGALIDNIRVR